MKYLVQHYKPKSDAVIQYKITEAESFDEASKVIDGWIMERKEGDTIFIYGADGSVNTISVEDENEIQSRASQT